ncbi:MAG: hypothetical protein Q8M88_13800 [Phenylobacterium sp.]|uniref:hypothetical protein n=1 Tax=Phenylobacterium sp. TaxID=1871053 RepID=UPI00273409BE|nr:hypothetical protein [Phenylobacterium sp.]MDP3175502.1 hypothetical protein [Phenylobacterium sp.]
MRLAAISLVIGLGLAGAAQACPQVCGDGGQRGYDYESYSYDSRVDGADAGSWRDGYVEQRSYDGRYDDDRSYEDSYAADRGYEDRDGDYADERAYGYDDRGYSAERIWEKPDGSWFMYGHRASPASRDCLCRNGGMAWGGASTGGWSTIGVINDSFFADTGGVGPIGGGDYWSGGGGYGFVGAGAFAGASARAHASASSSASISYRGGYKGGGHGGKGGGHKGGGKGH